MNRYKAVAYYNDNDFYVMFENGIRILFQKKYEHIDTWYTAEMYDGDCNVCIQYDERITGHWRFEYSGNIYEVAVFDEKYLKKHFRKGLI